MPQLNQRIVDEIIAASGSLEHPSYEFMEKRRKALARDPLVGCLMQRYFVKDDTDLNDHAAIHLRVQDKNGTTVQLCLSFVDHFAVLIRFQNQSLIYQNVVDGSEERLQPIEQDILRLLEEYGFRPLGKSELAAPIEMNLYNTDRNETRVFHAVVDDCGLIPQFLLEDKSENEE